ncbi:MAG: hypothetical protein KDC26_04360 [Armatimonadetes bacterium]|nr:hypothetical protein [Armatimonadota bacterium]
MKPDSSKIIAVLIACFAAIGALAYITSTSIAPKAASNESVESDQQTP